MSAQKRKRSSYILTRVEVRQIEQVSPNFVRITFGGTELDDFGTPGDTWDVRVKFVFPPASGVLPDIPRDTDDWYAAYLAVPEEDRGPMRTYSIRELIVTDAETLVVVDFVLHLAPGLTGPASLWASSAAIGDEVLLVGPSRGREDRGGIEFEPGESGSILLAGDETAAPAIARILEDSPRDAQGVAFIEVPSAEDVLPINAPAGVDVRWLARSDEDHGMLLIPAVLEHLGDAHTHDIEVSDLDNDDLVWETPVFSGLGEEIAETRAPLERYFWIAGESGVVTTLRRHLVKDLGIDRSQVAFMGYWRRGVSMRG